MYVEEQKKEAQTEGKWKKEGKEEECKKYNNSVTRSQTKYKKMKKK